MALRFFNPFKSRGAAPSIANILQQADQLQRDGQWSRAEAAYQSVLKLDPVHWDARRALASLALQRGHNELAIESYGALLRQNTDYAEGYYKRANALNALRSWKLAIEDYDRAIALEPDHANALCNRGVVFQQLKQFDEALASYDRAIALDPKDYRALYNRGNVLVELQRFDEGLKSYELAITRHQGFAEAYNNRGNVLQKLRRYSEAVASYDKAIELDARSAEPHNGRGLSLFELRMFDQAVSSFDRAIAINGDYTQAYINRANALHELRQYAAAIASYDQAIGTSASFVEAFKGRGVTLLATKEFVAAIENFERGLQLKSDEMNLLGLCAHTRLQICDWSSLPIDIGRLEDGLAAGKQLSPPFPVLALLDSPLAQLHAAELWVESECPMDISVGHRRAKKADGKIRVAYFSGDFHDHPVAQLIAEVIESHDRSQYELFGISLGPDSQDDWRRRICAAFDHFIDVSSRSDEEVIKLTRDLKIDIAVDLAGFTQGARTRIFAGRAAPVQVNFLGYAGTMGAPYIDYLIADSTVIPADQRPHYREKIVYLPESYMPGRSGMPSSYAERSRERAGLPSTGFVFCCFNNSYKLGPHVFDVWARILQQTPGSVLWLSRGHDLAVGNLRREMSARGVDPERLIFAKRLRSAADHLSRHRAADLFLDTHPYNAHVTAVDALHAGLPVLTLPGRAFAGRVGASLLESLRLGELICTSSAQYEATAIRLAQDRVALDNIASKLAVNRKLSMLFDSVAYTKNLESAFARMVDRSLRGLVPDDIDLSSP